MGGATSFNRDISQWDTSSITRMAGMFWEATSFNRDISQWDTSSVKSMRWMFNEATSFNGDVSQWDTSSVTDMFKMFSGVSSFNQVLCWNLSSSPNVSQMFDGSKGRFNSSCATD